ncbi:MAG: hypothetical protein R3C58_03120 [Parvularculaceae bacterium]
MMKFIASTVDGAKDKARRALGDKAVVISVRNLPSGDFEVTASDKPAPSAPKPAPKPGFAKESREIVDEGPFKVASGARLNEKIETKFAEDALSKLSSSLTGGKAAKRIDMTDATVRSLAEILAPHGVGEELMSALIDGARRSRIDEDLYRLETGFRETFSFAPLAFSPSTPIMLVGPTGAGKTSSAAKLAASAQAMGVAAMMITADVGRAGAIDQIRAYGEALDADYFIAESPLDVTQILKGHRHHGAVIFDTPGISPYDSGDVAALRSYRDAANAEPVLVLPASGDADEYVDWANAFKEIGVRRTIITKFDATKRVGAGLRAAFEAGLALAHFSETAFISEGLLTASPEFLARRLIASRPGKYG